MFKGDNIEALVRRAILTSNIAMIKRYCDKAIIFVTKAIFFWQNIAIAFQNHLKYPWIENFNSYREKILPEKMSFYRNMACQNRSSDESLIDTSWAKVLRQNYRPLFDFICFYLRDFGRLDVGRTPLCWSSSNSSFVRRGASLGTWRRMMTARRSVTSSGRMQCVMSFAANPLLSKMTKKSCRPFCDILFSYTWR